MYIQSSEVSGKVLPSSISHVTLDHYRKSPSVSLSMEILKMEISKARNNLIPNPLDIVKFLSKYGF